MKFIMFIALFLGAGVAWWNFRTQIQNWFWSNYKFLAFVVILICVAIISAYTFGIVNINIAP